MEENKADWTEATEQEAEADRQAGAEEAAAGELALTDKVLWLMEKIADYGYLTMQEIPYVFGNKTWAYKVMSGLKKQGLVADFDTLLVPRTAHYLTARGYRFLGISGKLRTGLRFRPGHYNSFIFRHRMACAKVGLLLEKHPLVHEFQPEILLWKQRAGENDKVCDGEFLYKTPGHDRPERVGLEVELTLKNREKLDESFLQLGRRKLDQVWWICGDETILRALRREVLHRPSLKPQRHFFILLTDFLAAKEKAELMEPTGALLSIDPAKPTLLPSQPEPPPRPLPPESASQPSTPTTPLWRPAEVPLYTPVVWEPPIEQRPMRNALLLEKKSWLQRLFKDLWVRLKMQCTPEFGRRPHLEGADQDRARADRRIMLFFAALGIAAALSPSPFPLGPGPDIMDWISPPKKHSQAGAWRKLKPSAVFWALGDIHFSIASFESRGEQYRMRLNMERFSEATGGCILDYVALSDSKNRRLARWQFDDAAVHERESWDSEPLSFHAPASARRFIVTVGFVPQKYECGHWDFPVSFK